MCGIVGVWDFKNKISQKLLEEMRDTLTYRGPDDSGIFIDQKDNIGLGHRRLSILDLSPAGHQPMANDNDTIWITFNGEVYNFKEIRDELENKGYKFKSNSDTEVILKSYEEWGMEAIKKYRGMFAFAIWNKKKEELFLVRDRAGVKPLYYYFDGSCFLFASELKAFHKYPGFKKEINFDALALFLRLGYIPAPHTIFKNTYKLEPGHYLEVDKNGHLKKTKYWNVMDYYLTKPVDKSEKEIEDELEKILIDSFKLRLVSDVPVGVFLSGGVDSTLVAAILKKHTNYPLKTFTIGFHEKEYNEAPHAKKIAEYLKTDHNELYCTPKDALEIIPKLSEIYDEPFGDSSAIPTCMVSEFAKKYVKTSLSADAGDEIFAGYNHYYTINKLINYINTFGGTSISILSNIFPTRRAEKIKQAVKNKENIGLLFESINSYWSSEETSLLMLNKFSEQKNNINFNRINNLDVISQMQIIDYLRYLPDDILVKVDRATMSVGLEGRDPFLDNKIIEYAASLPPNIKYKKNILKNILARYIPKEIFEKPKHGFGIPVKVWFKDELKYLISDYLDPQLIKKQGIFNSDIIEKEVKNYLSGKSKYFEHIWLLLMFQMWKEKWF